MSKYVEFALDGGGSILIEAADDKRATGGGFVKTGAEENVSEPAGASFDQAAEAVRGAADSLVSKLHALSQPPDELEVTFGLKASGEAGSLFVARGGGEANFNVVLRWHKEDTKVEKKE